MYNQRDEVSTSVAFIIQLILLVYSPFNYWSSHLSVPGEKGIARNQAK